MVYTPKNKLYLSHEDFLGFHDIFAKHNSNLKLAAGEKEEKLDGDVPVFSMTFVVTESCNLACTYCYETHKTKRKMPFLIAKKAIDNLLAGEQNEYINSKKSDAIILEFIGGEPLLEIGLIDQITEYFKHKAFHLNHRWATNYMISISTNGVLYFDPKVQDFLKKNEGKISLGISVDGDKKLHDSCRVFHDGRGSYEIVAKAAREAIRRNLLSSTKATLSPQNIGNLFEAMRSLREEIGYSLVYCNCIFEDGWTLDHAKIFYHQLKLLADYILENKLYDKFYVSLFDETLGQPFKDSEDKEDERNWCGGNGKMLAVDCEGKYFSCLRFMKMALNHQPEQSIGSLDEGFLVTPKQREWASSLKAITMETQSNEICKYCPVRRGCAICLGFNYDAFGDANHRATYICMMHKARVCANFYYWNKLYKMLGLDKKFLLCTENIFEEVGQDALCELC